MQDTYCCAEAQQIKDFNDKTTTTMFIHGNSDDADYER